MLTPLPKEQRAQGELFIFIHGNFLMNKINPKHTIPDKFNHLLEEYPNIDVKAMGFPEGWSDEPLWSAESDYPAN